MLVEILYSPRKTRNLLKNFSRLFVYFVGTNSSVPIWKDDEVLIERGIEIVEQLQYVAGRGGGEQLIAKVVAA